MYSWILEFRLKAAATCCLTSQRYTNTCAPTQTHTHTHTTHIHTHAQKPVRPRRLLAMIKWSIFQLTVATCIFQQGHAEVEPPTCWVACKVTVSLRLIWRFRTKPRLYFTIIHSLVCVCVSLCVCVRLPSCSCCSIFLSLLSSSSHLPGSHPPTYPLPTHPHHHHLLLPLSVWQQSGSSGR